MQNKLINDKWIGTVIFTRQELNNLATSSFGEPFEVSEDTWDQVCDYLDEALDEFTHPCADYGIVDIINGYFEDNPVENTIVSSEELIG